MLHQFGMVPCTAGVVIREVCKLLQEVAASKFICLTNAKEAVEGFKVMGFPDCVGELDSTHISILQPSQKSQSFVNRKGFHLVILQAVDYCGRFTNTYTGSVGSAHDACHF